MVLPLVAGLAIASSVSIVSALAASAVTLPVSTREGEDVNSSSWVHGEPLRISQLPSPVTLRRDSSGDAVSALQRRLSELGYYNGPISGYYGEQTEAAVMEFQRSQGMTADGVVGSSTTEALRRAPSTGGSRSGNQSGGQSGGLTIGASGDTVNQIQSRLTTLGFYSGPITGYYGELTEEAVRRFQGANGLSVDGVVGPATLAAIQQTGQGQSSSASTPNPNDGLLEQGESGSAVAELQRRLRNLNYYNGAIDGDFGSLTADAVMRFQRAQGLTPDGIVGPATLSAISRLEGGSTSTPSTSTSNTATTGFPAPSSGVATAPSPGTSAAQTPVTAQPPNSQGSAFPPISSNPFPSTGGTALPSNAVTSTASPEAIMALQRNLREQGFYNGPIDGIMGPETQRAVDAVRNAYGINSNDFETERPF